MAKRFLHEDDKTELQNAIAGARQIAENASTTVQEVSVVAQEAAENAKNAYSPLNKPTASDVGARPNANLLHNWYFPNAVNRNGKTDTIDRWKPASNVTTAIENGYITITNANTWDSGIVQTVNLSLLEKLKGQTVTGSVMISSEDVVWKTFVFPSTGYDGFQAGSKISFYVNLNENIFGVRVSPNDTQSVIAVKLELGDTQTLAHQENGVWVLNEIPDYAEQMAICMQYDKSSGEYKGAEFLPLDGSVPMSGRFLHMYDGKGLVRTDENSSALYAFPTADKSNDYDTEGANAVVVYSKDYLDRTSAPYAHAVRFKVNGVNHLAYGDHNVTKGTSALTAGSSALNSGCIYLQYE